MKKMIIAFGALFMFSVSFAQPTPGEFGRGRQHEMRKHGGKGPGLEKLNLTDTQKAEVKSIKEDFRRQMKELDSKENITVKEQRDRKEALVKAQREKIQGVLTPEQKAQLAQFKADGEKRRAERAEKLLLVLKEKLSLTDDQVISIKSKQDATKSKMDALLKNEELQGTEKRQQVTALRQEMRTNIESVLTPEQKIKMQELRKERQDEKGWHGRHGLKDGVK